jgi:E3 ubiquitin-protein ligase HUWE1
MSISVANTKGTLTFVSNAYTALYEDGLMWTHKKEKGGKVSWVKVKAPTSGSMSAEMIKALAPERARALLFTLKVSYLEDSITLVIDREHTFRDSLEQFRTTDGFDLHKEIKIFYVGEVAQDAGGLMREWVTELARSLFGTNKDSLGLFKQTRSREDLTYFPNHHVNKFCKGAETGEALRTDYHTCYRFAGMVLAKGLFEKVPVNVKLHPVVLKRLVGRTDLLRMEDLRDYDEQIYNSLQYLATDPTVDFEMMDLRFSIMDEDGSELDLIEGGRDIVVTEETIEEYCLRVARHYLVTYVQEEMKEFLKGFFSVIPR